MLWLDRSTSSSVEEGHSQACCVQSSASGARATTNKAENATLTFDPPLMYQEDGVGRTIGVVTLPVLADGRVLTEEML